MARVGVVPILGAVALLLLLALRRHQPPARVIRKHQRHSRRAARNFFVGAPIDVAADADASTLRRVARLASHDRGRGPELSLICSDADGAAMALNSLLNHIALGYRHAVVVGYEAALCSALGEAARQLPPALRRKVERTPCVHDAWWERHLLKPKRNGLATGPGRWLVRWSLLARLVRLGYNVLVADTDAVLLDDVLRHLHSRALCGRFPLMFGAESPGGGLQNGVVYACGALRDGGAAWVLQEVVDRYLRTADSCGGSEEFDAPSDAACPAGSWLRAAKLYPGWAFDQRNQIGAVQSAAAGNGINFWFSIQDLLDRYWPFDRRNGGRRDEVWKVLETEVCRLGMCTGRLPTVGGIAPPVGGGSGIAFANFTRSLPRRKGPPPWRNAKIGGADAAAGGDVSEGWPSRFSLGREQPRAYWLPLKAAPPLAARLPPVLGAALDAAWQRVCAGKARSFHLNTNELAAMEACRREAAALNGTAVDAPSWPLGDDRTGLLPNRRGPLSRGWQATLDGDLRAGEDEAAPGGGARRAGGDRWMQLATARDGPAGAFWAAGDYGDEALAVLPMWVACHWTYAKSGVVGGRLPSTLVLHATNSWDKELLLKALGYWRWEANHARPKGVLFGSKPERRIHAPEARIFHRGERPRVIAFSPELDPPLPTTTVEADPRFPQTAAASAAAAAALGTSSVEQYVEEVVTPLLLGALASGRLPAFPHLPCEATKWAMWFGGFRTPLGPNGSFVQGACRTGACGIYVVGVGTAAAQQRADADALAAASGYASPFPRAEAIGRGPLRCVPMLSILGKSPLNDFLCKSGKTAPMLQPPEWDAYRERLLSDAFPPRAASLAADLSLPPRPPPGAPPNATAPTIEYAALLAALDAAGASTVAYLPSRLRVRPESIPAKVRRVLSSRGEAGFCALD